MIQELVCKKSLWGRNQNKTSGPNNAEEEGKHFSFERSFCNKSKLWDVSEAANWFTVDGIILHQTVFVQAAKYICQNCQTYLSKLSKVFDQITNFEPSERPCMRENWWFVIWSFWRDTFSYNLQLFGASKLGFWLYIWTDEHKHSEVEYFGIFKSLENCYHGWKLQSPIT